MSERNWGVVKWFGGYNRKTGKDNDYGFLTASDGSDVFFHKKSIIDGSEISEGLVINFSKIITEDKVKAEEVSAFPCSESSVSDLCTFYFGFASKTSLSEADFFIKRCVLNKISDFLLDPVIGDDFIDRQLEAGVYFLNEVFFTVNDGSERTKFIFDKFLYRKSYHEIFVKFKLHNSSMPDNYLDENISDFLAYISTLEEVERREIMQDTLGNVSAGTQLAIFATGLADCYEHPDHYGESLKFFEEGLVRRDINVNILDIVRACYSSTAPEKIKSIIEESILKRNVYLRKRGALARLKGYKSLEGRLDLIVICNLLYWLEVGNDEQTSLNLTISEVWRAFVSREIKSEDFYFLNSAFPSCSVMEGYSLSCEAVFWEEKNIYLCRKKRCYEPRVFPDLSDGKNYLEYNIYDWLAHYGYYHLSHGQPAKKDFPIKLSGYFNRLREIFKSLQCRACHSLMNPDLKYARTRYKDIENGQFVEKELMAAYRVTVFECSQSDCHMLGVKHYLNHCLNYKCHALIDSRDCMHKCDNGYYSCRECGQCCSKHQANKV